MLIKSSKHLEALYYLDKQKELCRDDLNKLFGQVAPVSLNVQKIFAHKVMQLEQALSEINDSTDIPEKVNVEKRKISKKRNSIAAIQLNVPNARRPSQTGHLKQLIRQRTLNNILYKDELLEANLAKRCTQNRRSSLSEFIKNSLFGNWSSFPERHSETLRDTQRDTRRDTPLIGCKLFLTSCSCIAQSPTWFSRSFVILYFEFFELFWGKLSQTTESAQSTENPFLFILIAWL